MAINYSGTTMGTFTLVQKRDDEATPRKYKIQLRKSNCLACFMHIAKIENKENPKMCWRHTLVMFFADEQHLKNCMKEEGRDNFFERVFDGKLENIKLNLYHKECNTLLKYMVRDGLEVKCYYKEDNK